MLTLCVFGQIYDFFFAIKLKWKSIKVNKNSALVFYKHTNTDSYYR
ncbi:hypothetical protein yberc0001_20680 [Yersinia bercovieri ATCC 43970]|uniref:Uncharacterized protein n=1 Tax=Yersinia bercovieri ATCC 43970 TaxID=349968 RepID=A0ABP2E3L2_YERBE|nr:hypothetical protein yberc0001_20680 [Yersinia bercovieri ATCC 43970]